MPNNPVSKILEQYRKELSYLYNNKFDDFKIINEEYEDDLEELKAEYYRSICLN